MYFSLGIAPTVDIRPCVLYQSMPFNVARFKLDLIQPVILQAFHQPLPINLLGMSGPLPIKQPDDVQAIGLQQHLFRLELGRDPDSIQGRVELGLV